MFQANLTIARREFYGLEALDQRRRLKLSDNDVLYTHHKTLKRDIGEQGARLLVSRFADTKAEGGAA